MRLALLSFLLFFAATALSQEMTPYSYDIGTPTLTDYYIDPVGGSDSAEGLSPATAWRTVQHAWNQIPQSTPLTMGYRLNLMNGSYGVDELPNYWELRNGTFDHPIILRAAPGHQEVILTRDINMAHVKYFYLMGVNITPQGGGDAFHCEECEHVLLRGNVLNGGSTSGGAHETLKVNQSRYIYVENNQILNADDNNIDFVGVQYGHLIGNDVHDAHDWCAYVKGGSAYLRIEGNRFYNCGTGGFTAGQGTGFQFMTAPWVHYEVYDIKFVNNVIHDTEGAAIGVNGGYNILVAYNTAYAVGSRSHNLEVVFGERTCDGASEGEADAGCAARNSAGGWGAAQVEQDPDPIGNRNVTIANNVIYNPTGHAASQHFAIYGPRSASTGSNIPSPQHTDTNLVIVGNILWNGGVASPLGIEDPGQGCQPSNPTCTAGQLTSENQIDAAEPSLSDVSADDYRPVAGGVIANTVTDPIAPFPGDDRVSPPLAPLGLLINTIDRDRSGTPVTGSRPPGAYASPSSVLHPPAIDGYAVPDNPQEGEGDGTPSIQRLAARQIRSNSRVAITLNATVSGEPVQVNGEIARRNRTLRTIDLTVRTSTRYRGRASLRAAPGTRLTITVVAINGAGEERRAKIITLR